MIAPPSNVRKAVDICLALNVYYFEDEATALHPARAEDYILAETGIIANADHLPPLARISRKR